MAGWWLTRVTTKSLSEPIGWASCRGRSATLIVGLQCAATRPGLGIGTDGIVPDTRIGSPTTAGGGEQVSYLPFRAQRRLCVHHVLVH